jgi:hypothetical protein
MLFVGLSRLSPLSPLFLKKGSPEKEGKHTVKTAAGVLRRRGHGAHRGGGPVGAAERGRGRVSGG